MVCPHSVIRARYYDESALASAPPGFASAPLAGRGFPNLRFTLQVAVEDCTGCELCIEVCPAKSLEAAGVRAINMEPKAPILERERRNLDFFATLPDNRPAGLETSLVRGIQYLTPLFEYSGACAGCGETPICVADKLFGDRLMVENATGSVHRRGTCDDAVGRQQRWSGPRGPIRCRENAEFGLRYRSHSTNTASRQGMLRLGGQLGPNGSRRSRSASILRTRWMPTGGARGSRAELARIDDRRAAASDAHRTAVGATSGSWRVLVG